MQKANVLIYSALMRMFARLHLEFARQSQHSKAQSTDLVECNTQCKILLK